MWEKAERKGKEVIVAVAKGRTISYQVASE